MQTSWMNGPIGQTDELPSSYVKGMHCAAFSDDAWRKLGNVKTPNMLASFVFGFAQQGRTIITPLKRHLWLSVPFGADGFPSCCLFV